MSDSDDALRKAVQLNKQLAAKQLARKQELEADLVKLRAAGAPADAEEAELLQVEAQLASALDELKQLRQIAANGPGMAAIDAILDNPLLEGVKEQREQATPRPTQQQADDQARAEFEAMRDRLAGKPGKKTL